MVGMYLLIVGGVIAIFIIRVLTNLVEALQGIRRSLEDVATTIRTARPV